MDGFLGRFRFVPNGRTTHADAVYSFVKDAISLGRVKSGERLPTIKELAAATGLSFRLARGVMERLAKEGYVHSRPRVGTIVLPRDIIPFHGRVLFTMPDVDVGSYHVSQITEVLRRILTRAGYIFSVATFSQDPEDRLSLLKHELSSMPDLVIAMYAPAHVRKCLCGSGAKRVFLYGERPGEGEGPWIRFSPEEAIAGFAAHCARAGVKRVVEVRFDGNETPDAREALAAFGVECSMLTIPRRAEMGRYEGIERPACEAFMEMPRASFPDLFLFWDDYVAQGALMAFVKRGIQLPADVRVVSLSNRGLGPVYPDPLTRFECDAAAAGETVAAYAIAVLGKGRLPPVPVISPQYVYGKTFPF